MSWVEQFMNWYPRHTKLYRRKNRTDPVNTIAAMKLEFDELKPFFLQMANTIWAKACARQRDETLNLAQAVLQCTTLEQAKAMARQAVIHARDDSGPV
jgi:hypothetical protein